jgi:purine-binding chemotaxis protein CheW
LEPTPLQRALQAAPERAPPSKAQADQELFFFRLGGLKLAVPSENVREVIRSGPLTPLPRVPSFILGVCGHRGEVFPVLDLLRFLGKGESRIGPRTRLFVGISSTFVIGVVCDSVIGLSRVPEADILPAPMGGDVNAEHLLGVLAVGRDVTPLLSFVKVLETARQRAVAR